MMRMFYDWSPILALAAFTGMGCTLPESGVYLQKATLNLVTESASTPVELYVSNGTTQLHLDAFAEANVAVDRVIAPNGDVVMDYRDFPSPRLFSQGLIPMGSYASFNWPVRPEDGVLSPGNWTFEVAAIDYDQQYVSDLPLRVVSYSKTDTDLASGNLNVRVLFDQKTTEDVAVQSATQRAVAIWSSIYSAWNIKLNVTYEDTDLDYDLELPRDETDQYLALNQEGLPEELTIVVGHYIDGGLGRYGITGAIPGALDASPKGVVLVSWLAMAGPDAMFDELEIALYGETLAHEVGHYLGLFHPVEDAWDRWDFISDTTECMDAQSCESELGQNLMFPYPICTSTECTQQRDLTADQSGVIHRYTGTL